MSGTNASDYEASYIDQSEFPSETLLVGTGSKTKRVSMEKWAHETMSYVASVRNRKMTQGVLAYECLLYAYDLEDDITKMEEEIDRVASASPIDVTALTELKTMTSEEATEFMQQGIDNPEKKRTQVQIWLPTSVMQTASWQRGWGRRLEEAIPRMYASAFTDRPDRIECKRQLVDYVESGVEPTHPVAVDIVNGEMDEYVDSPEILTETVVTSVDDYYAIADDLTKVKEQEEKMFELYENMSSLNKGHFVTLQEHAHEISEERAEEKVENWCKKYQIYNHAPIDEKTVTKEKFAELADELVEEEVNEADLVNQLFRTAEENGEDKMMVSSVADVLSESGFISSSDAKKAGRKLKYYDDEYGLPSMKYIDSGRVYLSTYVVGE